MSFEPLAGANDDEASVAALAAKAFGNSAKPVLIRFVNDQALSSEERRDKPLAKAAQESQGLVALFDSMDQDFSMTARHFRLISVSVSGVKPKESPAVNRLNAPFVAVLDAEGNLVKVLGPGSIRKADLMPVLGQALKPRILEKLLAEEKAILREVLEIENLKAMAASKRTQLATAKGASLQKLEAEMKGLEEKLAEREKALKAREAALYGNS